MKLLLVRHAAAAPRGTPGVSDDDRPLTLEGVKKFRAAARGLARIARTPDVLLTSPLPRARATAEIAARAFKRIEPRIEPALAHGGVDEIVAALKVIPATRRLRSSATSPLSRRSSRACSAPRTGRDSRSRRAVLRSWTSPTGSRALAA